jgi:SanA protein
MRRFKKLILTLLIAALALVATVYICYKTVKWSAEGKLYTDVRAIPYNKVGLLLGTTKYIGKGSINPYYHYRIQAAAQLVRAGKIKYIIASGDNSTRQYNEPQEMKEDLIKAGVPPSRIFLDYAGFRTFDSIVRLREIFGQDSVTIISQPFHNERAIYLASCEGLYAVGFNARDVNREQGMRVQTREKLARVKVFVDYLIEEEPKFLGKKVVIPD